MKTFYFKLGEDNIILDAVEFPAEGYTEVHLNVVQLPAGINGGWYTWNGISYEIDESKKPANDEIKSTVAALSDTVLFLLSKMDALTGGE